MTLKLSHYDPTEEKDWPDFLNHSNGGTIFHSFDFLRYHGERFSKNEHHLAWYKGQTLFGIMPMAIFDQGDSLIARSPYGASYGGPMFSHPLSYSESHQIVTSLLDYLRNRNVTQFEMALPIPCLYRKYSETFQLALIEQGFHLGNRDISSIVSLSCTSPISEAMNQRSRRSARKARKAGVEIAHQGNLDDFWHVNFQLFLELQFQPPEIQSKYSILVKLKG